LARARSTFYRRFMETERRAAPRRSAHVYFNKYIDGHPYLCEAVELSASGMLVRRVNEPDAPRACYALELAAGPLGPGDERIWLCASPVWSAGELEALEFVAQSARDRELLEGLMSAVAAAA
jgi:hypothetical protein